MPVTPLGANGVQRLLSMWKSPMPMNAAINASLIATMSALNRALSLTPITSSAVKNIVIAAAGRLMARTHEPIRGAPAYPASSS
jgi:hypothetical protein